MEPFYICYNPDYSSIAETVQLCASHGFGIELSNFSDPHQLSNTALIDSILAHTSSLSHRALHGPYLGMYPGHPDPSIRESARRCFEQTYATAIRLGVRHIILHHTYDPQACSQSEWVNNSQSFWNSFLKDKPADIRIHLENVMDAGPELLAELIAEIGRPYLDVNLDIGHVHVYSQVSLIKWITTLGKTIGYVHLHDNHGAVDEHFGLGKGNLPLVETCQALREFSPEAVWSIEAAGVGTPVSIQWLSDHGFS